MQIGRGAFFCACALIAIVSASLTVEASDIRGEDATYMIKMPQVPKGRCILGFQLAITNGVVEDATHIPLKFALTVANSSSWGNDPDNRTLITGDVQTGVLSAEEINGIRFHIVKGAAEYGTFAVQGFVRAFDCADMEDPKPIKLGPENFEIVE